MAIVKFSFQKTEALAAIANGAENLQGYHNGAGYRRWFDGKGVDLPGPTAYWTWDTYVGCCLKDTEHNSYHDSDFHMLVWDDETQTTKDICFASTRGWSYPSYASRVDATPEVLEKFRVYKEKMTRENRIKTAWNLRQEAMKLRDRMGLKTRFQVKKLADAYHAKTKPGYSRYFDNDNQYVFSKLSQLLISENTGRLRSEFKKNLASQVRDWVESDNPRFPQPLSKKQLLYAIN